MVVSCCDPGMQEVEVGGIWISASLDYAVTHSPVTPKHSKTKPKQTTVKQSQGLLIEKLQLGSGGSRL